jgi:hypothetical protein
VFAPRVANLKTKDSSSMRAVEASTPASRRAAVDRNHPGAPDKGAAALFAISGVAGPAWDLATVPVLPSSSGARSSESEPSRLSSWARSVARARDEPCGCRRAVSRSCGGRSCPRRAAGASRWRRAGTGRRHAALGRREAVEPAGTGMARAACRRGPRRRPRSRGRGARAMGRATRRAGLHPRPRRGVRIGRIRSRHIGRPAPHGT